MQRLRTVTLLDVWAVAGHHAMPAALLFLSIILNTTNTGSKQTYYVRLVKLFFVLFRIVL